MNCPHKVVHILNGWNIKYSGKGVSIDNFLYRVEALTRHLEMEIILYSAKIPLSISQSELLFL